MISNPVCPFINGFDTVPFVYEGGTTLYHFSPYDNNLSKHMHCNVIFLANSEAHAINVLKRMFEHIIECGEKYLQYKEDIYDITPRRIDRYRTFLRAANEGKIKLTIAPTNQFYKVGWAENDTV